MLMNGWYPSTGSHSFEALRVYIGSHGQESLGPAEVVDPQAAWVALGSVLVKELLYRKSAYLLPTRSTVSSAFYTNTLMPPHLFPNCAALEVARQEKSNVLEASALHHRSDAFSGLIALAAIVRINTTFSNQR